MIALFALRMREATKAEASKIWPLKKMPCVGVSPLWFSSEVKMCSNFWLLWLWFSSEVKICLNFWLLSAMCLICWVSISSILIGLRSLSEDEAEALKADEADEELKADEAWAGGARHFIHRCLGYKLKTQARSRQLIADELWRLGLFSECVMVSGGGGSEREAVGVLGAGAPCFSWFCRGWVLETHSF